jgi:Ca2+-binding EF-hand superfamily protein
MRQWLMAVATLGVVLALGAPAGADDAKKKKKEQNNAPEALFKQLDADNDGTLTLGEFKSVTTVLKKAKNAKVEELFNKADTDKKGAITLAQFKSVAGDLGKKKKA